MREREEKGKGWYYHEIKMPCGKIKPQKCAQWAMLVWLKLGWPDWVLLCLPKAHTVLCWETLESRMTRDEQDPGDTAMINACQMIRGETEAGEMDLRYKLNYKNCLHRLEPHTVTVYYMLHIQKDKIIWSPYYYILKFSLANMKIFNVGFECTNIFILGGEGVTNQVYFTSTVL